MKTIYLAGPMSNLPQFNFPAFHTAAAALRAQDFVVISPAETDPEDMQAKAMASPDGTYDPTMSETWGDSLARDVKMLADGVLQVSDSDTRPPLVPIDGIVFLPGWEKSKGARLEAFVGLLTGKEFALYDPEERDTVVVAASFIKFQLTRAWAEDIAIYAPLS